MRTPSTLSLALLAACYSPHSATMSPRIVDMPSPARGNTEAYHDWGKNPWVDASQDRLSTFAADVDTASFTIARRKLADGELPPAASVRVEEWVNYFHYTFPPATGTPFAVAMDAAPEPFAKDTYVLRVGVATNAISPDERKPAHLVFLVDVSGSMYEPTKLPWVKKSLAYLTEHLKQGDTVSIVTYAGGVELILPPTGMEHRDAILHAIDTLHGGGSTAMASGIDLAYEQAMAGLAPGTTSRVIVCTDGDANVGPSSHEEILKIIEGRAKAGVTLSTIGFGMGNYKDTLMEQLADKGNGNNYYIDSLETAETLFGEKLASTIEVVAKDVKLQVEFDPNVVSRYRLIGYENRDVRDEQFRDDAVGGGQVGPGHQVTALYEVELKTTELPLGSVHVRHKAPDGDVATEDTYAMHAAPAPTFAMASPDLRFAFAVSALADVMRGNPDAAKWSLDEIRAIADAASGSVAERRDFVAMIDRIAQLRGGSKDAKVAR